MGTLLMLSFNISHFSSILILIFSILIISSNAENGDEELSRNEKVGMMLNFRCKQICVNSVLKLEELCDLFCNEMTDHISQSHHDVDYLDFDVEEQDEVLEWTLIDTINFRRRTMNDDIHEIVEFFEQKFKENLIVKDIYKQKEKDEL